MPLRPTIEAERQPRHANVVGDVRLLERVLVWRDLEALHKLWVDAGEHRRCAEPDGHRQHEGPRRAGNGGAHQEGGGERGDHGKCIEARDACRCVGVRHARCNAVLGIDKIQLVELIPVCGNEQDAANQEGEVEAWQSSNAAEATSTECRKVTKCSERRGAAEKKNAEALREAQHREAKEVERDVATEDWIDSGSVSGIWNGVLPERDLLPVRRNLCANEHGHNNCTDAQGAVANCGTSAARRAISVCAKEATKCIKNAVRLQIAAVIHEWGSRITRCTRALRLTTKTAGNEPGGSEADHQQHECRERSANEESALQL